MNSKIAKTCNKTFSDAYNGWCDDGYDCENCSEISCSDCAYDGDQYLCKKCQEPAKPKKKKKVYRKQELINEEMKSLTGYIDFLGSDKSSSCLGWDGSNSRCECGSRRVEWRYDSDDDSIYAAAW